MTTLRDQLDRDEGRVAHAYQDSLGYWTIGVGHLIDARKGGRLPDQVIDLLLDLDIRDATAELRRALPWLYSLNEPRRAVLVNMAFQLGVPGLLDFHKALDACRTGDWPRAAAEFLDSRVARDQTPERWQRHARQIETGVWQ